MIKNSTFMGAKPVWANACVGHNGNPSYVEYSNGFSRAANLLLDHVIDNNGKKIDLLIYPICFNMRHSVELQLKCAIEWIINLYKYKKQNINFDLSSSHDIGIIWSFFKEKAQKFDNRYERIVSKLDQTICDIAQIDPTGQTFRYPFDTKSQKHLTDVSVINCLTLKNKFIETEKDLDALNYINNYMFEEYKLGAFTSKLSRSDLISIAKTLPHRESWKDNDFKKVKTNLREKYSISSNELSKAINIIQNNYEMAPNISVNLGLLGLNEDNLIDFIDSWIKVNFDYKNRECQIFPPEENETSTILEIIFLKNKYMKNVLVDYSNQLSPEFIAGIETLYYFADDLEFCENYKIIYKIQYQRINLHNSYEELERKFLRILEKENFLESTIISLFYLSFDEIAENIIKKYELEEIYSSSIEKAKNREFFIKFDLIL